jgi:hypothetical protein
MPSIRFAILAAIAALALIGGDAQARVWRPSPVEQISDYLFIVDPRPDGSQVMIYWIAPQIAEDRGDQARLRAWTRGHLLFGIAEVDIKDGSSLMPRRVADPDISVGNRKRRVIEQKDFNPDLQRAADHAREIIGHAGQAFRFFAVAEPNLGACSVGSVQIRYERETYSYRMPAPGCSQAPPR